MLADFGGEDPQQVVENIVQQVWTASSGDLEAKKHMMQLLILSRLRNFMEPVKLKFMESLSKYISEEDDILFRRGEEKGKVEGKVEGKKEGKAEGKTEAVKNLLAADRFTIAEIANFAGVTEDFVEKIKENLK